MSCHGPEYRTLFESWQRTVATRTAALRRQLDSTGRQLGSSPPAIFADARANLELVERGRGIHNVPYSLALLEAAHRQLNEARTTRRVGELQTPWPRAPYESPCVECHAGAEVAVGRAFGRSFPHQPHVVDQGLDCLDCHSSHDERETTGAEALKLGAGSCNSCHHRSAATDCTSCHADLSGRTLTVELGEFDHAMHVDDMELACATCHGEGATPRRSPDSSVCSDCH